MGGRKGQEKTPPKIAGIGQAYRAWMCPIPLSCCCILGWSVTGVKVHVGIENLRCQSVHSNWCCSGIGLNSINVGLQQNTQENAHFESSPNDWCWADFCLQRRNTSPTEGSLHKMILINGFKLVTILPDAPLDPKLIHSNEIWARDKAANLALSSQPRPSALLCLC